MFFLCGLRLTEPLAVLSTELHWWSMYCSYSVTEIELMEQMAVHQKSLNISSSLSRCPKKQNSKLMCITKIGLSILIHFTFPQKMLVFLMAIHVGHEWHSSYWIGLMEWYWDHTRVRLVDHVAVLIMSNIMGSPKCVLLHGSLWLKSSSAVQDQLIPSFHVLAYSFIHK